MTCLPSKSPPVSLGQSMPPLVSIKLKKFHQTYSLSFIPYSSSKIELIHIHKKLQSSPKSVTQYLSWTNHPGTELSSQHQSPLSHLLLHLQQEDTSWPVWSHQHTPGASLLCLLTTFVIKPTGGWKYQNPLFQHTVKASTPSLSPQPNLAKNGFNRHDQSDAK